MKHKGNNTLLGHKKRTHTDSTKTLHKGNNYTHWWNKQHTLTAPKPYIAATTAHTHATTTDVLAALKPYTNNNSTNRCNKQRTDGQHQKLHKNNYKQKQLQTKHSLNNNGPTSGTWKLQHQDLHKNYNSTHTYSKQPTRRPPTPSTKTYNAATPMPTNNNNTTQMRLQTPMPTNITRLQQNATHANNTTRHP